MYISNIFELSGNFLKTFFLNNENHRKKRNFPEEIKRTILFLLLKINTSSILCGISFHKKENKNFTFIKILKRTQV